MIEGQILPLDKETSLRGKQYCSIVESVEVITEETSGKAALHPKRVQPARRGSSFVMVVSGQKNTGESEHHNRTALYGKFVVLCHQTVSVTAESVLRFI